MGKITVIAVLALVVLLAAGTTYILMTTEVPQQEAVVKDIPYDALNKQN